jgi:hypothetical protein
MEQLHELTGAVVDEFKHNGTRYELGVLSIDDWGEIEAYLCRGRPDPMEIVLPVLKGLDEDSQRFLLGKAYEDARLGKLIRTGELDEWLKTVEGGRTKFWYSIRKHHPEIDRDIAGLLFAIQTEQDYVKMKRALQGIEGTPSGNSESSTETSDPSLGEPSTESSVEPITGPTNKSDE